MQSTSTSDLKTAALVSQMQTKGAITCTAAINYKHTFALVSLIKYR